MVGRLGQLSGLGEEGTRQALNYELMAGRSLQHIIHVCAPWQGEGDTGTLCTYS